MLDTGPSPLSAEGGDEMYVYTVFCFLLHSILYTMQRTCTNEAYLIHM